MERTDPSAATATRHLIRSPIIGLFLDRHALSREDAIAFAPRPGGEARAFALLRRTGVIREDRPGRFHCDLATYYALAERRRRLTVPITIIVSVVLAAIATLFYRG